MATGVGVSSATKRHKGGAKEEGGVVSCNCGGGKKTRYEYTSPEGRKQIVQSQTEALTLVRLHGGSWRIVTS
jgi:hypothetical protein